MTNSRTTILDRLRALKAECGPNKHDQAIALISACILDGWNTHKQIVGALGPLGMNPAHVRIILEEGTGTSPARHFWRLDKEGRFSLLEPAAERAA